MIIAVAHDTSVERTSSDREAPSASLHASKLRAKSKPKSSRKHGKSASRSAALVGIEDEEDEEDEVSEARLGVGIGAPSNSVRAAEASDESGPRSDPTRHPAFWFHDGSIVLQVQSKLFRVHQTILANHSEIFADLFDIPQPLQSRAQGDHPTMLEGCHIVVLHDNEKDFEDLLRSIYNPSHFDDNISPAADVDTLLTFISGILRLSTKYLIRTLRQRCISLLTLKFPTTFDEYNLKSSAYTPSQQPHHSWTGKSSRSKTTSPPVEPPRPERYKSDSIMHAITLATTCNLPALLPYLYYCTARLSLSRILKARQGDISWEGKTICLVGRERLRYAEISLSYNFLMMWERARDCEDVGCGWSKGPEREWRLVGVQKAPNPLRSFGRWKELGVCVKCETWARDKHERGRAEVWERLPEMFGLEAWDKLKEEQARW